MKRTMIYLESLLALSFTMVGMLFLQLQDIGMALLAFILAICLLVLTIYTLVRVAPQEYPYDRQI